MFLHYQIDSVDSDQTAPLGSGPTLFAIPSASFEKTLFYGKATFFKFYGDYSKFLDIQILRNFNIIAFGTCFTSRKNIQVRYNPAWIWIVAFQKIACDCFSNKIYLPCLDML